MTLYVNHLVVDDFLPPEFHDGLLNYALANHERFVQTRTDDADGYDNIKTDFRLSWRCEDGLGEFRQPFKAMIKSRFSGFVQNLRVPAFDVVGTELEFVAHRNGSFFRRHVDTATQSARDRRRSDRIISVVYYLHAHPKGFSGGELALAPLGKGEPLEIEPRDNRLVAFPSFVPHEVNRVICEDNDFANARFAVNCWLHRAKALPEA